VNARAIIHEREDGAALAQIEESVRAIEQIEQPRRPDPAVRAVAEVIAAGHAAQGEARQARRRGEAPQGDEQQCSRARQPISFTDTDPLEATSGRGSAWSAKRARGVDTANTDRRA